MKIAFLMDPLSTVKPYKDTSYFMMLGAQQRGHQVFHLGQEQLYSDNGRLFAEVTPLEVHDDFQKPFSSQPLQVLDLGSMDMVVVRTDPPFDRRYFYTTLLLDLLPSETQVLNRPSGLRNWNEKLATLFFAEFGPRTMVTQSAARIKSFMAELGGRITLKPIDGHGGRGILFLEPTDPNLDQLIGMATHDQQRRVIAQAYVPEAKQGDKRILLLNGEPMGAILRLHPEGKELNNLDQGGKALAVSLTERDHEICRALAPALRREGLFFVGIDMLGDKLTEINVTSPTGLRELANFSNHPHHLDVIAAMEALQK